ncbi:MAG: UrcA family protein [Parvularculaceae bacterium]|nr:UrcA family protein [Parvularculaceae bacterium]
MMTLAKRLASAAALGSILVGAEPALADDVAFSYAASDLRNSDTLAALYERLSDRAWRACALYQGSGLLGVDYQEACAADLMTDFIEGIDDPGLSALHEQRGGARFAETD